MRRIADARPEMLHNYERLPASGAAVQTALPPETIGISPFMESSLPAMSAGLDQLTRQFYGRGNLPQRRLLVPGL